MGIIAKQGIQNTIISYIGIILGFIYTVLLFPHILSQEQYGLTRLLLSLALVSTQFAHLGIRNVVIRYFPYFKKSRGGRNSLLTLAILVSMAGFGLFTAFFLVSEHMMVYYYSDQSSLFEQFYYYLLPLVFAILFFESLNTYVRALKDSVTGSFFNEVLVRILIIILLGFFYFSLLSFYHFMTLFVLIYSLPFILLVVYLYYRGEWSLANPFHFIDKRLAKDMGVYGAYSLIGGLATILVGNIDIIMLGSMTDLESTAIYAIAFYIGSVIAVPKRSIDKIAIPLVADLIKSQDFKMVSTLYRKISLNQMIAGSLLLIGVWANMHNLLDLLPEEYESAYWIIIMIGFAKFIDMISGINGDIILNSVHYRFILYTNIFLILITIATNYLLIPHYGILGAAIATALSIFIYNLIKFIFVWVKFSMQPFIWNSLAVLSLATGCLLFSFQIPYLFNLYIDIFVRSLIIFTVFLGFILLFNLSEEIKILARQISDRIINFFR